MVSDPDGNPLPGVTVTLTGTLTAPLTSITSAEGNFRFLSLPSASDYTVKAELEGFKTEIRENVIVVVDDSHGVGALGATGRGSEEVAGGRADLLVATLGKALGVNGGYVVGDAVLVDWLRETAPFYVYSNPITPA